jgi:hypothetical protein
MKTAFKEWAVVCRALAEGTQIVILRKGGIVETGGEFRPDHLDFWLFPTYLHQSSDSVIPLVQPWLAEVFAEQPPPSTIRFTHHASVVEAIRVHSLDAVERLRGHHIWSDGIIAERFHRWGDSIYALVVRVYSLPAAVELPMRDEYGGCKSWVELAEDIVPNGSTPVLDDVTFEGRAALIRAALMRQ